MFLHMPSFSFIALWPLSKAFVMFLTSDANWTLFLGEAELASGSDVNGSTESFEMVIEETSMDSAVKQNLEGKNKMSGLY